MRRPTQLVHTKAGLAALGALVTAAFAAPALGCAGEATSPATGSDATPASATAFDAANFTGAAIDNPYLPLRPGTTRRYEAETDEGHEVIEVTVTDRTKRIAGVKARVVRDTVRLDGSVIEDTYDWFAQDRKGNVWYLGEDTKELENGKVVSTAGSWEAGVRGAKPGIVMPAKPTVGATYQQEYDRGNAEDAGKVLSVDEKVEGPTGFYRDVVMTKDYTPLEPRLLEHKFYAKGVGFVLEVMVAGGTERVDLMKVTHR